ncbi:lytic transglycosylase domain-containing protein [Sphingobium sp. BYY-5]|uniref:lytic transglycosylase domain-containing protein n=1 Tax=Sphingobium sp. BYY-5 TaxID=2926400 RepID=UPI001FA71E8B|nr:lytic transglycosylase domain-containing protein [Sphingobium sp. BYY-5]MCI4592619.1 lytic transglycosylase domain-containing protein [Sphingobium sp. BYY-5]
MGGTAVAQDNVSWRDIDFGSCPLHSTLRVAGQDSVNSYMALQGCAARIVAAPRAPIRTTPDVARITGVKGEGKKDIRRRKTALATPPAGTRRVSATLDQPIRIGRIDSAFEPHIQASAQAYRIDPLFLHAIIGTESTYEPSAISHAGARGLMQIMPDTGARFGVAGEALYDPATNIDTGARLLKSLQKRYGKDFTLILAAYNAGEGAVERYGNQVPPYRETQDYVGKVMRRYAALRSGSGL